MALAQSALLELLEALKTADNGELMRRLLTAMLQSLIEAEAPAAASRTNALAAIEDRPDLRSLDTLVA